MDKKPNENLMLVKGKNYERPRGEDSLRFDAFNCNLNQKWP